MTIIYKKKKSCIHDHLNIRPYEHVQQPMTGSWHNKHNKKNLDHCFYYSRQGWNKIRSPIHILELNGTKGPKRKTPQEEWNTLKYKKYKCMFHMW